MATKGQFLQWLKSRAGIGGAAFGALALMTVPVLAQWGGFGQRGGNFDSFFSPYQAPRVAPAERADYSRAPSPRKLETQPSGGSVLVLGDSMADWLAYGLEDALGDPPDLAVVRKNRASSGLIRYDSRNENQDWPQVIRESIAATKPKYVVMMVGLNDRVSVRDRVTTAPVTPSGAKPGAPPAPASAPAAAPAEQAEAKPDPTDAEQGPPEPPPVVAAPEPPAKGGTTVTHYKVYEFRTEEWEAYYSKRIDATIAALKSAGVPVFWVGLPSIRGPKSTADMQYLDDLYRGRVEKAGLNYIDVWDGFVDDSGRYVPQGPDFEGQTRRLRAGDGVHFTKAGARKLAHYLEREIRRVMAPGAELVALPSSEPMPATPAKPSGPAARPLAGPVVPLTASVSAGQELAGGKNAAPLPAPKSVTRALVNGDAITPPAGRADDFAWPRRVIAPVGTDPIVATTTEPIPVMQPAPETTVAAPNGEVRPVASAAPAPRRPRPVAIQQPSKAPSFFSFFR
jgi:hypothetical protein